MERWLNKIHLGDCLDIMSNIPSGSIDLVVTSPPYNLLQTSAHSMTAAGKPKPPSAWKNPVLTDGYEGHDDKMDHAEYVDWQRNCLTEMLRLLPEDGAIFYNHKWRVQNGLLQDRTDILSGFPLRQIIIWDRKGTMMQFAKSFFGPCYEVIYLICKPEFYIVEGYAKLMDIWRFNPESGNEHPAPFPVELPTRCIRAVEPKVVLDPFIGSGTTAVAAHRCGVDWIGIEKSEKYVEMANGRIERERSQLNLFT